MSADPSVATQLLTFKTRLLPSRGQHDKWRAAREAEADRLSQTMDMTPEGYVREWIGRGRVSGTMPLEAWEHAYNRAQIVGQAERLGYIEIGRDVACTIKLRPKGEALLTAVQGPQ